MSKSAITETHNLSIQGELDVDSLTIDCQDLGTKNLKDLFAKFDKELITITIKLKTELD